MKDLASLGISPAPWKLENGHTDFVVNDAMQKFVASCLSTTPGSPSYEKACNNARLIASAPMLYEALEECERKLDACDPYCNLLEKVRRALAAASGESEVEK